MTNEVKYDALGLPYVPRPLPPQPPRSLLKGTLITYRSSNETNVAATIKRARKEMKLAEPPAHTADLLRLPLKKERA